MNIKKAIVTGTLPLFMAGSMFVAPAAFADSGSLGGFGLGNVISISPIQFTFSQVSNPMKVLETSHNFSASNASTFSTTTSFTTSTTRTQQSQVSESSTLQELMQNLQSLFRQGGLIF